MWIVGENGKRVGYNSDTGKWTNATNDVIRIGNAMMLAPKGKEVLNDMLNAKHGITLTIDNSNIENNDNGSITIGITSTWTKTTNGTKDFGKVEIKFYEKALSHNKTKSDSRYTGLSEDEILGANGIHEGTHATKKDANSSFNSVLPEQEGISPAEQIALDEEQKYLNQLNDIKK